MPRNPHSRLDWFPWYPAHFRASQQVMAMSLVEECIYRRLLDAAWQHHDCSLPNNDRQLARLAGVHIATWRRSKKAVLACFDLHGDRWQNPRLSREFVKANNRVAGSIRSNQKRHNTLGNIETFGPTGRETDDIRTPIDNTVQSTEQRAFIPSANAESFDLAVDSNGERSRPFASELNNEPPAAGRRLAAALNKPRGSR